MTFAAQDPVLLRNYIAGEWLGATEGKTAEIREPARTRHHLWSAVSSTPTDFEIAIDAASSAAPAWRATGAAERASVLDGAAAYVDEHATQIATDLALEQGKTLGEARREVAAAVTSLRYYAGQAMEPVGEMLPPTGNAGRVWAERVPLGNTVCITPWNFPLLIPTYKIAPALGFGNTVVLKPASLTPRAATYLIEALIAAGAPPGTVNLCLGSGATVLASLADCTQLRAVSFTGSNAVGMGLKQALATTDVRLQLEMGGKNPILVLDDANVDSAAKIALDGAMGMAGQRCTATSRAIILRSVSSRFAATIRERSKAIRVGHPLDDAVSMGPLISEDQRLKVTSAIDQGRSGGATLIAGGASIDGEEYADGHFLPPTIFDGVDPASPLARDEIFGPVLSLITVDSIDEAVQVANDSAFGLTASVCTGDLGQALRLIDLLDFGVIQVNRPTSAIERYAPFGGTKGSGYGGREQGRAAREFFTEWKTVYLTGN